MQDAEARHLADGTKRKYRVIFQQLNQFAEKKGVQYVNQIDVVFLSDFRATWKNNPLTATKKLEQLRGICKFALSRKWLADNPALLLQRPKVRQTPTLPFSDDEMERILKTATGKDRTFVLAMRFSGLRISDVCKLERESLVGDELRLRTHKTGTSVRVPMPKKVADYLRQTLNPNPKYFFWSGHT